ncbi:MAG: transcriptional regulator [Bacillota bacterium]|nr:transcriptional regulator [Bacillota bacterium]
MKKILFMLLLISLIISGCSIDKTVDDNIGKAVSDAILTDNEEGYLSGECRGEGHIILKTEEKNDIVIVYAQTMYGEYGFQNDNFVKISGSGNIPAVIEFKKKNNKLSLYSFKYPKDGADYVKSIKEMFPLTLQTKVLYPSDKDLEELSKQERVYAQNYLKSIGREAKIGDYGDFEHNLLTDVGVPVEVSNKILKYKELSKYPDYIGTQEFIENGERCIYRTSYNKEENKVIFSKIGPPKESSAYAEYYEVDGTTGELLKK